MIKRGGLGVTNSLDIVYAHLGVAGHVLGDGASLESRLIMPNHSSNCLKRLRLTLFLHSREQDLALLSCLMLR